jgi:hypothetical protein
MSGGVRVSVSNIEIPSTETKLNAAKTTSEKLLLKSKAFTVYNIKVTNTDGSVAIVARRSVTLFVFQLGLSLKIVHQHVIDSTSLPSLMRN